MTEPDPTEVDLFTAAVSYSLMLGKLKAHSEADPERSRSTSKTFVLAAADGRVIDRIPLALVQKEAARLTSLSEDPAVRKEAIQAHFLLVDRLEEDAIVRTPPNKNRHRVFLLAFVVTGLACLLYVLWKINTIASESGVSSPAAPLPRRSGNGVSCIAVPAGSPEVPGTVDVRYGVGIIRCRDL